ncbi:von Willebrand factor type A domain-containing protein [Flavobacterium sp.]|uniref:vWA domain-containing protein n=1 Tax=Flavobacterium sp. TaxID=239 RepID=UPI0031D24000
MKSLKLISSAIAMLICFISFAQERTITGIVTDKFNTALPGVTVLIKGTKKNTQTDFDGKYTIQTQKGDILVFTFIGYENQSVEVKDKSVINVTMQEAYQNLQEVVVTSYGSSDSEYEDRSYARAERRREKKEKSKEKVAGVQIQNNVQYTAIPSQSVAIRGITSVSPKNEPLYIIDGVPAKANQMAKINPNDIDNVSVLKDQAATSVYGNKASNGVVVISTKNEIYKNLSEKELDKKLKITPIPTEPNQEDYDSFVENAFESPKTAPLSTFSIDVDNASYTNIRRFLNNGQEVPKDAVRVEEMVNFFKYTYPQPKNEHPFSINTEVSDSPWNSNTKILKIGLQGKNIPTEDLPASNLVFLIDVSGSMSDMNKLPLLKQSLKILVNALRAKDKVAIVVYAGAAGMVLPPTSGDEKKTIVDALDKLQSGGSTAGGAGIELAYKTAAENFIKGGNNRVILATDGDFNVGSSSNSDMEKLIEEKRKTGVFLTCLGYGMGNYKDSKMEILADKGNGNYAYIDNIHEANRFLGKEFKGSMFAIAKDVKIQIEFNPKQVQAYRLIGYENRKLRPEDFKNDAIDAGELGSNHTVTALYEIIPAGVKSDYLNVQPDDLKYTKTETSSNNYNGELATIKFRYKKPDGDKSIEMVQIINNRSVSLDKASDDFKFSTAVAWFGLKLRDSKLITQKSSEDILELAQQGISYDKGGYKAEFIRLIETSEEYN